MQDLIQDFIAETRETLEAIQDELIAWEVDPRDRSRLEAIFRFFHTVKGSCGFLELPRLTRLSHAAEDALDMVRRGERQADGALVSATLALADRIVAIVDAMECGGAIDDKDDDLLIAAVGGTVAPDTATAAPPLAPVTTEAPAPQSDARQRQGDPPHGRNWTVRVPIHLLDQLMNGVSDLVLARNELSRQLRVAAPGGCADGAFEQLSAHVAQLRESIGGMRMQRVERLFAPLARLVRDIGGELGKAVQLELAGGEVEIDREMIDHVRDPLTHLIRNAVDHGIESEAERLAVGKPPKGRIRVAARQVGNHVLIEVADDGRGIDIDRLVAKAIANRVTTLAEVAKLDERGRLALIFRPGLSTADKVSTISGRGVGMDVVRTRIEAAGGSVDIDSARGRGLSIKLHIPLTLSIITGLIVRAGDQCFAVSQASVDEILRLGPGGVTISEVAGASVAEVRGRLLPHVRIESLLGLPASDCSVPSRSLVLLNAGMHGRYVLEVDEVIDSEELVVKPAVPAILSTGLYAGMSLPDSGRPMLLLDAAGIAHAAGIIGELDSVSAEKPIANDVDPASHVLLFRAMDDELRAIRLDAIDRMDEMPVERLQRIDGHWRIADGASSGIVIGLSETLPEDMPIFRALRLCDGDTLRFLAIREAYDLAQIDSPVEAPRAPGRIEGIFQIDGRQIELIDPYALFEEGRAEQRSAPARRRCHIVAAPHDGWSRTVLRPLLARAGYFVSCGPDEPADAEVVIAPEEVPVAMTRRPVIRLGHASRAGEVGVDRYDRSAILAALAGSLGSSVR